MKKITRKCRMLAVVAAVLCLSLLVGCTAYIPDELIPLAGRAQERISLDEAKAYALEYVGLEEATFTQRDYDLSDGAYELEFYYGSTKYEVEVDAYSGRIRDMDTDRREPFDWWD